MSENEPTNLRGGKIVQLGYDEIVISPRNTSDCLYCLQRNEIEAICAILEPLNWRTRWYSSSDTDIDPDAIETFTANLTEKLMSCCGDAEERLTRITDGGEIEVSTDGGETWIPGDNEDDPRIESPEFPPLPGTDDDDKKCVGANNTLSWFQQYYTDQANKEIDGASIITLIGAAVAVLLTLIAAPAVAFLGPFFMQFIAGLIASHGAVWKSAIQADDDLMLCLFFCRIQSDASFSDADVAGLLGDIASSAAGNDSKVFYRNNIKILQSKGLTNAARSNLGGSRDCSECLCGDGCNVDNWHVYGSEEGEGTDVYGTELDRDDVSITAEASLLFGSYWVILWTSNPSLCCVAYPTEVIEGDLGGTQAWIPCGGDFPVTTGAMGDSRCVYLYQINDESPFKVKVTFQTCPP